MPTAVETPAGRTGQRSDREAFARAVMAALAGEGGAFSAEAPSSLAVTETATKLRLWLLVTRAGAGGASATVSPEFLRDTYPAMLALARALDDTGLGGVWAAEDERTFRLGRARHVFVSVDRPLRRPTGGSARPDTLLEVVSAERVDRRWFHTRVCSRARARGLTTVVYGRPGADTLFEQVRARNLLAEWSEGVRRHFSLMEEGEGTSHPGGNERPPASAPAVPGW